MHIAIIADPIDNQKAGVYTYTKNLILELLKLSKSTKFTFIHEKENDFFEKIKEISPNANHIIIPRKKFPGYNSLRKFFLIPKVLRRIKPNIVLDPCHIGPFNLPKTIKRAVTIHDLTPILFPQFHIRKSTIIHKLLLKRVLKKSDIIITTSNQNKKDILEYSKTTTKIEVIPLGLIDEKKAVKTGPTSTKTQSAPYILYLGTIEPRKNLELLIDAFSELKKEKKIRHNLIIAGGTGWKAERILEKAKKHPDIIMTGFVEEEEKEKLYRNASVFVYPSIYEGFGLPPMEALSHNLPLICSTGGALKEIYKNRASLFEPHDKERLKILILRHTKKEKKIIHQTLPSFKKTAEETLKALKNATKLNQNNQSF
jgi:glycosyltransferase involved in cell wall biosynthesis